MLASEQDIIDVCRRHGIRLMVLYGSRAAGRERPGSDVDVGVALDRVPQSLQERLELEDALERELELNRPLHLVLLDDLNSTTLGREIYKTGKPLYDRDGEQWGIFVCRAFKDYVDFEPARRLRDKVLRGEPIE